MTITYTLESRSEATVPARLTAGTRTIGPGESLDLSGASVHQVRIYSSDLVEIATVTVSGPDATETFEIPFVQGSGGACVATCDDGCGNVPRQPGTYTVDFHRWLDTPGGARLPINGHSIEIRPHEIRDADGTAVPGSEFGTYLTLDTNSGTTGLDGRLLTSLRPLRSGTVRLIFFDRSVDVENVNPYFLSDWITLEQRAPTASIRRDQPGAVLCLPGEAPELELTFEAQDPIDHLGCGLDHSWRIDEITPGGLVARATGSQSSLVARLPAGRYQASLKLASRFDPALETEVTDLFTIDGPPTIQQVVPAHGDSFAAKDEISFEVTVTDDVDESAAGPQVTWSIDGPTPVNEVGAVLSARNLDPGYYQGSVLVMDSCGHEAVSDVRFAVEPRPDKASVTLVDSPSESSGIPGGSTNPEGKESVDSRPDPNNEPPRTSRATLGSCKPCAKCADDSMSGDPVHLVTGTLFEFQADLALEVLGCQMKLLRVYRSDRGGRGSLGSGWRHVFERQLRFSPGGVILEVDEMGGIRSFEPDGAAGYRPPPGSDVRLETAPDGKLVVIYPTDTRYTYTPGGRLLSIAERHGNAIHLDRGAEGELTRVWSSSGRELIFEMEDGLLKRALVPGVHQVQYAYENDRLRAVVDTLGQTTFYSYDPDGRLTTIQHADGSTVENVFQNGLVVEQIQRDGGTSRSSSTHFEYMPDGVRRLTDAAGGITQYQFDGHGRLLHRKAPDGSEEFFERDDAGRLIAAIHPDGTREEWAYGLAGRPYLHTARDGQTTLVDRDPLTDHPLGLIRPDGAELRREFTATRNISATVDPEGRETRYEYTPTGQLAVVIEPDGGGASSYYDSDGQVVAQVDTFGQTTTFVRDPLGQVIETRSILGRTTRTEYENGVFIRARVDALEHRTEFERDAVGRITATILANGARTEQKWATINGNDVVIESRDPLGAVTRTEYDPLARATATIDALGRRTALELDSRGRVTKITHPDGTSTRSYYTLTGLLDRTEDALGRETHHRYDAADRLIETILPDGTSSKTTYDPVGRTSRTTTADGATTTFEYNRAGELVATLDALGHRSESVYGPGGNVEMSRDALGRETLFEYDAMDRLRKTVTAMGFTNESTFDEEGNVTHRIDAAGHLIEVIFDPLHRPIEVKNPLGHSVKTQYDSIGNVIRIEDENGHAWTMNYDLAGRKTSETDPNGRSVSYEYDLAGQLLKKTLADGATIEMAYDEMGRVTERVYKRPDGSLEDSHLFEYNIVGNRTFAENSAVRIQSDFDVMDRETERYVTFKTDAAVPLVRRMSFTYDVMGRRKTMDDHAGRTVRYTYDLLGRLTRLDLDSKDRRGRIKTRTYHFRYDAVGNLLEAIFPNKVRTRRSYDSDNRLMQMIHETVAVTEDGQGGVTAQPLVTLQSFDYERDPVGNILRIDEAGDRKWSCVYDAANQLVEVHMNETLFRELSRKDDRLTAAQKAEIAGEDEGGLEEPPVDPEEDDSQPVCRKVTYTYDPAGNRILEVRDGVSIASTYSPANEMLTAGRLSYAYDLRGNMTEKVFPGGRKHLFAYNVDNRLASFSRYLPAKPKKGIPAVTNLLQSYFYSPDGERTGLYQVNLNDAAKNKLTHMLWDGGRVVEAFWRKPAAPNQVAATRYLWGMGQLLEQGATKFEGDIDDTVDAFELASSWAQGDASRYAHVDQIGSVRLLTKPTGEPVQASTYGPWGEPLEGGTGSRFGYTGHQREAQARMHYSVHRYLDYRNGRWTQRDPLEDVDGQNRYHYVMNGPLSKSDPTGELALLFYGGSRPPRSWGNDPTLGMNVLKGALSAANGIGSIYVLHPEQDIQRAISLIDGAGSGEPIFVIGHSNGALAALQVAEHFKGGRLR